LYSYDSIALTLGCKLASLLQAEFQYVEPKSEPLCGNIIKQPARGLTVIAASMHGLLRPTCNHNHKLVASASAEIFGTAEGQ